MSLNLPRYNILCNKNTVEDVSVINQFSVETDKRWVRASVELSLKLKDRSLLAINDSL